MITSSALDSKAALAKLDEGGYQTSATFAMVLYYASSSILAATQAIVEAPMLRTRSSMVYLGWCNGNLGFLSETTLAKALAEIDANPGEPAKSVPEPHEDSH